MKFCLRLGIWLNELPGKLWKKVRREKILKDGEKCARTYVCEIFARTCDVAEQEGSVRSESRSGARSLVEWVVVREEGAGAAGMLTQAPGPLWSCTHMQWHGADSQSSALLRLTDEQWQHKVSLPLGGSRQKGCFDSVWKCTAAVFHVFASVCLCVQGGGRWMCLIYFLSTHVSVEGS